MSYLRLERKGKENSMLFASQPKSFVFARKLVIPLSAKTNFETYDSEMLAIVAAFK